MADSLAILLTDGQANTNVNWTVPETPLARSAGVQVFTLGLGEGADMEELAGMASSALYWHRHLMQDLLLQLDRLYHVICSGDPTC